MSCPINRETITNGIVAHAETALRASPYLREEAGLFHFDDEEPALRVAQEVNDSFGEEVVVRFPYQNILAVTEPSGALVDQYLQAGGITPVESRLEQTARSFDQLARTATPVHDGDEAPSLVLSSKAGAVTKAKVLRWLETIGFGNIQTVSRLTYRGQPLSGRAYVDFALGVMQIVDGQEDYTLPEEAMTILLQLVKQSRRPLYEQMMRDITSYKLYGAVLSDPVYRDNKLYQLEDGSPNYEKLKEEAVTKLLAELLTNEAEGTEESARRIEQSRTWLQAFLQWVRDLFGAYKNPFRDALKEIERDPTSFGRYADIHSDEVFLSAKPLSQVDEENKQNKAAWERIKQQAGQAGVYKVGSDYYNDKGKVPETQRVSNLKVEFYKAKFGQQRLDPAQQAYYDRIAQQGTDLHAMIDDILTAYVDSETGLLKKTPSPFQTELNSPVDRKIFKKLHNYLTGLLSQYDEGTRFLTEQVVYDPEATNPDKSKGRYGTIDFLAVLPDGTIDVLDWKSSLFKGAEEVKDYKKEGYFVQLNEYKRMLSSAYGQDKFRRIRAIPISQVETKRGNDPYLSDINIGDADAAKINRDDRYLRPIISPEEKTGVDSRDKLIEKLELYYKKYINRGYFKTNRDLLDDLGEALYEIRTATSVDNLSEYLETIVNKFRKLLSDHADPSGLNTQDINDLSAAIQLYRETVDDLFQPAFALLEEKTIEEKSRARLYRMTNALNALKIKGDELEQKIIDKKAKDENIFTLLVPEKVVGGIKRWFRSMGSQEIASVQLMYELVKKAYDKVTLALDTDLKRLKELRHGFEVWRKTKRLSERDAISWIVDRDKGTLVSKIDRSFYEARQAAFDSRNPKTILAFVEANYDLAAWQQDYNDRLKENIELWSKREFDSDAERTGYIRYKSLDFAKRYNIRKHPVTAFGSHNKLVWSKGLNEDKWLSQAYQDIQREPEVKALYDFFVEKNRQLEETGAIEEWEVYTFFPHVRKSLADIVTLDDKNAVKKTGAALYHIYDDWRKSISVSDYELNYQGAVSETGEKLDKRFVAFTNKLQSENRSFDLFKVYGLMAKEIHRERYMQQNDNILRSLAYIEKNKATLKQNKYSTLAKKGNGYEVSDEKGANFKTFEPHYKAIVLGETLQVEDDAVITFRLREAWNNTFMGKLYRFNTDPKVYQPTNVSATKFLFWMNNLNTKRILGLNAGSIISNLFGGTYSSNRLFERYTSKADINRGWAKLTSGAFWATEDMKKNAALADYFLPLLDNNERLHTGQLSVSDASRLLSTDWLMAPMRKTSEIVQLNIFFGVIENTGLENGHLFNIRERAASETGYYERFSRPAGERKQIEEAFAAKIKAYKDSHGLVKHATFKTIQEAGTDKVVIDIPGVDRGSEDVEKLREIVRTLSKDALGEADEFDMMGYKYKLIGRLLMTFKNWVPRTVDVRFGEFRYSQSHHAYEYGRFRMFARSLSANYLNAALRLVPFLGKVVGKESLVQRAREVYQEKLREAKELGLYHEGTFLSEGEFVERFLKGVQATYTDFRMAAVLLIFIYMPLTAPDDDDDKETKGYKALLKRQLEKLLDEITFFYSPKSGVDLLGTAAPITGIVKDSYRLFADASQQFFGFALDGLGASEKGEALQEEAKPVKRLFKVVPVFKEILTYLPAVYPEVAKEWDVRVANRNNN